MLGRFERAVNLANPAGWVISITLPEVGQGPFSIVVAANADFFNAFVPDLVVTADRHGLTAGRWHLDWHAVAVWEPQLAGSAQPFHLTSKLIPALKPYTNWPNRAEVTAVLRKRLRQAAAQFGQALGDKTNAEQIGRAAASLAGLGNGLTPAGDDYLVGAMAALWLTGFKSLLPDIAGAAVPQTTTLSGAFLNAAARGEFMEPWHHLVQSLYADDMAALSLALVQVAHFGASSGLDALAGFSATLLDERMDSVV